VGLLLLPASAQAQQFAPLHLHEGFWFGVSGAYAQAHRICDQCSTPINTWGPSLTLAAGGTVNQKLLMGGEFGVWYRDAEGIKTLLGNGSITARWYPLYRKGLYLRGGVGFSIYQYRQSGTTLKGAGPGVAGAVGYDFMVGRRTALAPMVGAWWGAPGALKVTSGAGGVGPASGLHYTVLELGLSLTFY
jgi:hypothetical protein